MIHLDTTLLVDLLREGRRGEHGRARARIEDLVDEPMCVSVFVAAELRAGAELAANPGREHARVDRLLDGVSVVFPDARFAPRYGQLLAVLHRMGQRIATMDLLIGTAAVVEQAALVTRNPRHFTPIPELDVRSY